MAKPFSGLDLIYVISAFSSLMKASHLAMPDISPFQGGQIIGKKMTITRVIF